MNQTNPKNISQRCGGRIILVHDLQYKFKASAEGYHEPSHGSSCDSDGAVDDTGCRPFDHRWPRTASVVDASQERYTDERASYTACAETARDDYDPG